MDNLEPIAALVALGLMALCVCAKVVTVRLVTHVRQRIYDISQQCNELRRQEMVHVMERKTLEANLTSLDRKKTSLEGKQSRLNEHLQAFEDEALLRVQQREARTGVAEAGV
jgi:predicted nuclease with TOPRIM domain